MVISQGIRKFQVIKGLFDVIQLIWKKIFDDLELQASNQEENPRQRLTGEHETCSV